MSVTIPATGSGTQTPQIATEIISSDHYQLVKLIDGNVGSASPVGTVSNPIRTLATSVFDQPIVGSIGVTQIGAPWSVVGSMFVSPASMTIQDSITAYQGGQPWTFTGSVVTQNSITALQGNAPWSIVGSAVVHGSTFHGSADTGGAPVKVGAFAVNSEFPTPVNSGARVNLIADHHGRIIVTGIPQGMMVNRSDAYVGPLSGTVVWSANVNGQINVTNLTVAAGSSTAGLISVFFARSGAPVNFTTGSGVFAFQAELAPSATAKPGAVVPFGLYPCKPGALNDALRISISTSMQVYLQVNGYEEF